MSVGWIKLHRKLKSWEWYSDINTSRLFIHLLLSVNSVQGEHQGTVISVGCVKTGRKELAKQTGLSEQQVRRSIKNLQKTGDITINSTNKYSLITIVKWGEYQSSPEKATNKRADKQPTNAPANNHKQEVKKEDVKKKTPRSLIAYAQGLVSDQKIKDLLKTWLEYRIELKKPMKTESGIKNMVNELKKHSIDHIKLTMEYSMANEYQGLFFDKVSEGPTKVCL